MGAHAQSAEALRVVQLLVDVGEGDTVYRDLYLRRARALLAPVLSAGQYQGLEDARRSIDETLRQSKSAATVGDWRRVDELAQRVEQLRHAAEQQAGAAALGEKVYDPLPIALDPFSPGFESSLKAGQSLAGFRDGLLETLKVLAQADGTHAGLYESRRAFFAGLTLASAASAASKKTTGPRMATADLERLAFEAAQRGDVGQLKRYAQEIVARQEQEKREAEEQEKREAGRKEAAQAPGAPQAAPESSAYRCPVDLAVPFSDDVAARARTLGLAVARTEPLPEAGPIFDFVMARIWRAQLSDESEREGTMRAEALVDEIGWPAAASGPAKTLVGQFVRNLFASSGGTRYLAPFAAEAVLIEDFPEDDEPPVDSALLAALGLTGRRGLARVEIERALLEHGATILEGQLGLDPREFRLVCIPQDLYSRFGRDRGWGKQPQWTHFDGYHVLKGGKLRALAGGDARYGGVSDLVSIGITDQREGVLARLAVVRRARQVMRWR